jgi:GNAT superfamily N-acetyltransferase
MSSPYCSAVAEIRPIRDDGELERWLEVRNAVVPQDAIAIENVRSWMAASKQTHLLAFEGDELVAAGLGVKEPWQPEARVRPLVPFLNRGRGLGSALLAQLSQWAASEGYKALLAYVELGDEASIGFAERRGFAEIGRELKVELDLLTELPRLDPPEGVKIVTWAERPDLVRGIYEVYCEGIVDIPSQEEAEVEPFEDWLAHDMSGSGDSPEWTFVAVAGDEVVGYSKFSLTSAQPHTAHHDLTAVKRAWRGRGIAGALKSRQLAWAQDNCYLSAVTNNEERNEPIRRLNERFGYLPAGGRILMRGPLVR